MLVWPLASWLRWQGMLWLHLWSLTLDTPVIKDCIPEIAASRGIKYLAVRWPSLLSSFGFTAVIPPPPTSTLRCVMLQQSDACYQRLVVSNSTRQQKVCQESREQTLPGQERRADAITRTTCRGRCTRRSRSHGGNFPPCSCLSGSLSTPVVGPVTGLSRLLRTGLNM